jgi:GNAT superfamily N-acetyltransferase
MIIRKAVLADLETIVDFQMAMALETEELALDCGVLTKGVQAALADCNKGQIYVAADGEKIIGSLMITYEWSDWRNGWVWWIESLYVVPEQRKNGIFKQMYAYIKSLVLADDAIKGIRLYVDKRNVRAQKVYDAIGMSGEHYTTYEWLKS